MTGDRAADHNKVLGAAARDALGPLGLTQKGRSRTWLDDHGWYVVVVEFQPSAWSKGSYLNVAAMWLWKPKDDLSFDYGGRGGSRVSEFERADRGEWREIAANLAAMAP
jgi:hypothetical protein